MNLGKYLKLENDIESSEKHIDVLTLKYIEIDL